MSTFRPISASQDTINCKYDYIVKILLIGDSGVGKSSMMIRFADDEFVDQSIPTIGVDFKIRTVEFNNKTYKIQIWDTAGQERFRTITSSYYRGAQGIIIVYDITNKESFDNVKIWLTECSRYNDRAQIILVGNKSDLDKSARKVSFNEAKEYANSKGYKFVETSAKTNDGIENMFQEIVIEVTENMVKFLKKNETISVGKSVPLKRKLCC